LLIGNGTVLADAPFDVSRQLVQIESRPGVQTRMIVYRPSQPLATVILFPDGNGRFDITPIFSTPQIGRTTDVPWALMGHLLERQMAIVLMDAPPDHHSILGVNGWHGPAIFRLSRDHARDIRAAVDYLTREDPRPIWLAGIRMGAFSAVTAAIDLQEKVTGLVIADGITRCPAQKTLLALCPQGLMGLPLQKITIPTLILSHGHALPEPLLTAALSQSPALRYLTYPGFAGFEKQEASAYDGMTPTGLSDAHLSSQMADFIAWNERINPFLICDSGPAPVAPEEIYLAGIYF
jgi:pimeloyl-ACP methyl ester carboxylesterase